MAPEPGPLDPVFLQHGRTLDLLECWATLCLAPRNTDIVFPDVPIDNTRDRPDNWDNRPPDLPMAGTTLADFYHPAHALSGQQIEPLDHAYTVLGTALRSLENLTYGASPAGRHPTRDPAPDGGATGDGGGAPAGDYVSGFAGAMDTLFSHWTGDAAAACKRYVDNLVTYIGQMARRAGALSEVLVAYWGAVAAARQNVITCMDQYCAQMHQKETSDGAQAAQHQVTDVGLLINAVLGAVALPEVAAAEYAEKLAMFLTTQVNAVMGEAAKRDLVQGGAGYSEITRSFFASSSVVVDDLRNQITQRICGRISDIRADMAGNQPPSPGPSAQDDSAFDADHRQFQPV